MFGERSCFQSDQPGLQVSKALLVRLEALPGREDDVRGFLNQGLSIVEGEPKTVRWFGIQFGPSSFGIFDAFPDEDGRQAHLSGEVAKALGENTGVLFEKPTIEQLDVVAEKQPA
uniref:putative quinol monooxygenase n=1 Tax=Paracoccus sphaerophysae TaxID=690417 RepID=UPI00068A4F75